MASNAAATDGHCMVLGHLEELPVCIGDDGLRQAVPAAVIEEPAGTGAVAAACLAAETCRNEYQRQLESCVSEVHRFVAQRVDSLADAEDIAQQALLQAWANLSTFRGGNLRAWLFTIARHLVVDHYRTQNRFQFLETAPVTLAELEPSLQSPREAVQIVCECRERLGNWVDCLTQRLPLEEQVAVLLADLHGHRDRDSASALGISLASFKLLLHQARVHLREIADGACTLLRQTRTVAAADEPAAGGANAPVCLGADDCPRHRCFFGLDCRIGIKCYRRVPELLALRDNLLEGLELRD